MKKTLLLLMLSTGLINAQTVIYNQPGTTTDGIVTDVLANGNFVASADDFTLSATQRITKINIMGFQNAGTLEATVGTGAMLYIYTDNAGKPSGIPNGTGTPVVAIDIAKGAPGYTLTKSASNYTFTIDLTAAVSTPVILQANTVYWLVFAAKTNLTTYSASNRFNWYAGQVVGNGAKLVDPSNAFGAGATNWTSISALTTSTALDGLAFSIEAGSVLGTSEVYSSVKKITVYPNPTSEILNIKTDAKINAVSVFDISGRKVDVKFEDNKANVKSLPSGTYLINVETEKGKITEKFIKK